MSLQTLNENLDIIGNLVIPFLEDDLDNVQKLDDEPNDVGGLTAAELKAEFDKSGNTIKKYLNETLIPQLSDTVAEAEVRATAERERVANENIRVGNENARIENEDARQENETARVNAEKARADAEAARKTAESQRVTAENTRESQEATRKSNETTRQTAENTRMTQESARQTAENARETKESARQSAESSRASAEQTRQGQETTRQSQETTRQTNEQTRQSNEQARKTAEAQRETNEQNRKDSFVEEIDQAKSWAVGGTGKRPGEDTNNAKYWSEQAKANVGGDFATNARVDEVEEEVGRVAQSVSGLETQVEQDVGQAIQQVNQTISGLEQSVNTRVQPINLGGTGASEANQARKNLGAAAVKEMTKAQYDALANIDPTIFYALTDVEADGVKIEVGSYVGTGKYGTSNPNSIPIKKTTKLVIVQGANQGGIGSNGYYWMLCIRGNAESTNCYPSTSNIAQYTNAMTWGDETLSWYNSYAEYYQLNAASVTYRYIAIGRKED